MPGAFGWSDWMRASPAITVTVGTAESGMPAENLYDPQPSLRARFIPSGGTVTIVVDLGASRQVGAICWINTTLTGAETLTVTGSTSDATGAAGDAIASTTATATDPDRNRGMVVKLLSADVAVRYLRLAWSGISGATLDIGGLAVMPTIRLQRDISPGMAQGRIPTGLRQANRYTGAEFRVAGLVNRRVARFTLPYLQATEYAGSIRNMLADTTPADDVLWIPLTTLSQAELNAQSIYGGLAVPDQEAMLTRDFPLNATASFMLTERV